MALPKKKLDGPQKAAIFLMAMGDEFSQDIFKGLAEYEIKLLGRRMAGLEDVTIPVGTVQEIMDEFQQMSSEVSGITGKGMDYLRDALVGALGTEKAQPIIDSISQATDTAAFSALRGVDPLLLVDYLKGEGYAFEKIYIMGFCSGAAASCIFASRNSPSALILDGCFADVHTMVRREAVAWGIPEFLVGPFLPGLRLMTRICYGYNVVNPIDVVADISCPVLFIHEEHDEFTTLEETRRLFESSRNPANELWEISGADHSQSYRKQPEEYVERVDGFVSAIAGGMPVE